MRTKQWTNLFASAALFGCICGVAAAAAERDPNGPEAAASVATPVEPATALSGEGFERPYQQQLVDPCAQAEVVSAPSRPNWNAGAATTQCGTLESDFGWLRQPIGGGAQQEMLLSSVRYGLTPKIDLRWGLTNHISQNGGERAPIAGVGDQSVSATYRFHEQGLWVPALAFSYGIKIPMANPAKGFGTGFTDHQLVLIASRDLGRNHLDFNVVGTLTGEARGHDGAPQFGLGLTRQMTGKLAWILEGYGGPQPGTADRYGAVLTGVSYSLRHWLVLDGAFVKTYTAGSPRQQMLFGFTYAMRPGFGSLPVGSRFAHLLGR